LIPDDDSITSAAFEKKFRANLKVQSYGTCNYISWESCPVNEGGRERDKKGEKIIIIIMSVMIYFSVWVLGTVKWYR
jgi:hypothetical protein